MESLKHVLWIGGAPRSGKTTVATRLARRHGLRWYNADKQTWEHRDRALRAGHGAAHRWEAMTADERWVTATPEEIAELTLDRERGPMIVDDVRRLPPWPLVVAEGSPLRPELVAREGGDVSRSVWLVPTRELHRARLDVRGLRGDVSDPRRAHENAVRRVLLDADEIERQARELGAHVIVDDGSQTLEAAVAAVEDLFADAIAEGPRAETAEERRALLRYANEAVVSQCLAYLARPWTTGDAEAMIRSFACECDDRECEQTVELAVAAFPRSLEPVLAPGHA